MPPWGLLVGWVKEGVRDVCKVKVEIRLQMELHFVAVSCLTLSREIGPQIHETESYFVFLLLFLQFLRYSVVSVSLSKWKSLLPSPTSGSMQQRGWEPSLPWNWFLLREREREREMNARVSEAERKSGYRKLNTVETRVYNNSYRVCST
jgi:hypothetical protein